MNTETIVDNPMMLIHLHWESDDPDDERTRIIAVGLHPNDEIGSVDYATIEKAFTSDDFISSFQAFRPREPKRLGEFIDAMRENYPVQKIDFYDDIVALVEAEMPFMELPERAAMIEALEKAEYRWEE